MEAQILMASFVFAVGVVEQISKTSESRLIAIDLMRQ